jgi:hypothetical protein
MSIQKINEAILRTGHPVTLVAVTKGRDLSEIKNVLAAGIRDIGESRWQEAKDKLPHLPAGITKHFIGPLQTNKVKEVVRNFDLIQSVDSEKLAQKISDEAKKANKIMPILIEVNTSVEPQKHGVAPAALADLLKAIAPLPCLSIRGLMTVAINSDDKARVRLCFRTLKKLFDDFAALNLPNIQMTYLSMGMSDDYQEALAEGSNMLRIGHKIFD